MAKRSPNLVDVNRFLPLRDIFGRTKEDDQRRNHGFRKVKLRARSTQMPDDLEGGGYEDSFYIEIRLREEELKLKGSRLLAVVRQALKRELMQGDKVFLLADRIIPTKSGEDLLGFRAHIDSIILGEEIELEK